MLLCNYFDDHLFFKVGKSKHFLVAASAVQNNTKREKMQQECQGYIYFFGLLVR